MGYTTKNYFDNGGDKTVIGGELAVVGSGKITKDGVDVLIGSHATTATYGTVKQAATQANSTAVDVATLVTDFNALLAKLKAAGIMA